MSAFSSERRHKPGRPDFQDKLRVRSSKTRYKQDKQLESFQTLCMWAVHKQINNEIKSLHNFQNNIAWFSYFVNVYCELVRPVMVITQSNCKCIE